MSVVKGFIREGNEFCFDCGRQLEADRGNFTETGIIPTSCPSGVCNRGSWILKERDADFSVSATLRVRD